MRVRSRLVLAFVYLSVTLVVAFTIPLALTLGQRARVEVERETLISASTIAQDIGSENLVPARRSTLRTIVERAAVQVDGRVVVVDAQGSLIADSAGPATGAAYATAGRPELVAALADTPTSVIRHSDDLGADIMATAVPIVDEVATGDTPVVGAVRITRSMEQVAGNVRRVTLGVVAIGVGGLLAALVLAFGLSNSLARPLRRLAGVAQRFGADDLSARVGEVEGPDEVRQLAHAFDRMADRVEAGSRAQQEFVANASHQLRTPLTGMKLRLEGAIADAADPAIRHELQAADAEVDRLSAIVDRLLAIATREEREPEPAVEAALDDLARQAVERWRSRAADAGRELVLEAAPATATVHPSDVGQILDAVLANALAYAEGPVEVQVGERGDRAVVAVRDHGPGVAADERELVTERFYRGARARAVPGSGLGLTIVRDLAERDGGTLRIEDGPGGGALVSIAYPLRRAVLTSP
jgi:signal transduction histidine kinase